MLGLQFQLGTLDIGVIQVMKNANFRKNLGSIKVLHKVRVKQLKYVSGSGLVHPILFKFFKENPVCLKSLSCQFFQHLLVWSTSVRKRTRECWAQ